MGKIKILNSHPSTYNFPHHQKRIKRDLSVVEYAIYIFELSIIESNRLLSLRCLLFIFHLLHPFLLVFSDDRFQLEIRL